MTDTKIIKQGWGLTIGRKYHYFIFKEGYTLGESLCRRIGFYHVDNILEDGNDNSVDNCAKCKKLLAKIKEKNNECLVG